MVEMACRSGSGGLQLKLNVTSHSNELVDAVFSNATNGMYFL